jgi:uncharacterized membrane protein
MANGPKIAPPQGRAPRPRAGLGTALRTNFLTGLVVVAPVLITFYIIWGIITFVDAQIVPLVPQVYNPRTYVEYDVPGFGLFIFVVFTTVVGYFTKNLFGRQIVRAFEGWVDRMPVVRSIYNGLKQIVETVLSQSGTSFQKACLIEYPRRDAWSIAFVVSRTTGEIPRRVGDRLGEQELVSVFLPSTPNPTTGFLLFLPAEDVVLLDMTIEEAAKLVISGGLVVPPSREEIEAAARRERARKQALAAAAAPKA